MAEPDGFMPVSLNVMYFVSGAQQEGDAETQAIKNRMGNQGSQEGIFIFLLYRNIQGAVYKSGKKGF